MGRKADQILFAITTVGATLCSWAVMAQSASNTNSLHPKYYIRGEIGGASVSGDKGTWIGPGPGDPRIFHRISKPMVLFGGFAAGMNVYRGIRLEAGYFHLFHARVNGQWIYTVPFKAGPHANMQSKISSHLFFMNGYVHPLALMNVNWQVQPFIGGGVGVAFNGMDSWTRTNPAAARPFRRFERGNTSRFAWNLAAGVSVEMTRWLGFPLTLDLTYRYVDAGRVRGSTAPYDPGNIPREAFNFPVRANIFTAGLRMPVGWSGGGKAFAFSPARNFALPQTRNGGAGNVAICSSLGSRFYLIPGTDTCLAVGGSVRYETAYIRPLRQTDDATGMAARAHVTLDARTPTAYGPVQTYLRGEFINGSGVFSAMPGNSVIAQVDRAFIRFGGLVVGQLQSMFDFYTNKLNLSSIGGSDLISQQISYAIDMGGAFVAGIGLESNAMRTRPGLTDYFFSRRPPTINLGAGTTIERSPNVVAAFRYDGTGLVSSAQLSAAIGEVQAVTGAAPNITARATGFAVQAGLRLNLPFFASGDSLWLQGAYAQGSLSYLGAERIPTSLGNMLLPQADATIVQGKMVLTRGYALTAAFVHLWTPTISQAVYGSIVSLDYPTLAQAAGVFDTKVLQAGTSLVWSPTPGFQLGGEIMYSRLDPRGSVVGLNGLQKSYVDQVSVRLRALREF